MNPIGSIYTREFQSSSLLVFQPKPSLAVDGPKPLLPRTDATPVKVCYVGYLSRTDANTPQPLRMEEVITSTKE